MNAPVHRYKPVQPSFAELFMPKLVTVLREGYGWPQWRADALAGLTVAIVALPLSMAIAIASGLSPDKGLFTAIVGGFVISAFGGSRFQIGGPAGAFIVVVAGIVERQGYDGLVLATALAGVILMAVGFLRLGTYIKYVPYPVTVGFTAGIALIIFASQLKELLGLDVAHEPAAFLPKLAALWDALPSFNVAALGMALFAGAVILVLRRLRPNWPGLLIAVTAAAALTALLHLDIATIASRFGGVPRSLPAPSLPAFSIEKLRAVLPDALTIALLGAIESLLSAVVADAMTGRRHRSNCELVAQGGANIAAVLFGGMPVTGAIARTATNIRSGAHGPIAGMMHAAYVLGFMLVAAPLAGYIPLAALGAVLAIVAWNMAEREEFAALLRAPGDRFVLLATFLLTVFVDLTTGIAAGVILGAFLFLHRMAETIEVEGGGSLVGDDRADGALSERTPYEAASDVLVYRITGAFFFGATATVLATLDRIGKLPRLLIFDFKGVPLIDVTAAKSIETFAVKLKRQGTVLVIAGASRPVLRTLLAAGVRKPDVRYASTVDDAKELGTASVDRHA